MLAAVYHVPPWRVPKLTRRQVGFLMRMLPYAHPWSTKFGKTPSDEEDVQTLGEKHGIKLPTGTWKPARDRDRDDQETIGGWHRAS